LVLDLEPIKSIVDWQLALIDYKVLDDIEFPCLLDFFKQRNHVEFSLLKRVHVLSIFRYRYLALDALLTDHSEAVVIFPGKAASYILETLLLETKDMSRYHAERILSQRILDHEDLGLPIHVDVARKVGGEDVRVLGQVREIYRELRESVYLFPFHSVGSLEVLLLLVQEDSRVGQPFQHELVVPAKEQVLHALDYLGLLASVFLFRVTLFLVFLTRPFL
jgi:hypothetical protein